MSETQTIEARPLTKRAALEYLEGKAKAVTAKELAIDRDSRASTASELLERMTAQGLVRRDEKQRPREYVLTNVGHARLAFFRSQDANPEQAPHVDPSDAPENPSEGSPGSQDEAAPEPPGVESLKEEIRLQFENLHEDLRGLFEVLSVRPVRGEGLRERTEQVKRKLESLAEQAKADAQDEAVRGLYRARYELRSLGWLDSKDEVKNRVAELEAKVGEETAEQVKRLVETEADAGWADEAKPLRVILGLREALHFPASVFGRASQTE